MQGGRPGGPLRCFAPDGEQERRLAVLVLDGRSSDHSLALVPRNPPALPRAASIGGGAACTKNP
jgi:hypothetical protein